MKNSIIVLCLSLCALAANAGQSLGTITQEVVNAGDTMKAIRNTPDNTIPDYYLNRAYCIATIPGVKKGAFIFGLAGGRGLVSCRTENGSWSEASFVDYGSGSFGWQIGGSQTDLILLFMNADAVNTLDGFTITFGGNAAVAAGPVGRSGDIGTDVKFDSGILSYSRSKGIFAGVDLHGDALKPNHSTNSTVYGGNPTVKFILNNSPKITNNITAPYLATLPK